MHRWVRRDSVPETVGRDCFNVASVLPVASLGGGPPRVTPFRGDTRTKGKKMRGDTL